MATRRQGARRVYGGDQPLPPFEVTAYAEEYHEGPIPAAHQLAAYEGVQAGLADRIVTMAEKALDAEIARDLVPVKAEARALLTATVAAVALPYLALGIGLVLILNGEDGLGYIAAVVGLLAVMPNVIAATRRALRPGINASDAADGDDPNL